MSGLQTSIDRIRRARGYTLGLLEATPESEWFLQPVAGVTHIAWQVGHIATAEYGLTLAATRGPRDTDAELISPELRKLFGRGSTVSEQEDRYPTVAELRAMLDRVHRAALAELATMSEADLEAPSLIQLAIAKTRRDAMEFCPEHEMLHAGQIGLLRRLFGHKPLR